MEIIFKQSKEISSACNGYRKIEKRGDLSHDINRLSDDAILISVRELSGNIIIDCDKKTGEFHLKFDTKDE